VPAVDETTAFTADARGPASPTTQADTAHEVIWFEAGDGQLLNFHRHPPAAGSRYRGPVLVAHGTSSRANIFSPPEPITLPQVLSDAGFDVWILNWRASIDLPPVDYTIEDAAVFDFPEAVAVIREHTGADTLKAFVHCQGSTSFMMAITAGLLPQVTTVITNAVSLHPVVPRLMRLKMPVAMTLLRPVLTEINPQWGIHAPGFWPKALTLAMRALHHECDNPVCTMASFTYGAAHPALWRHQNLSSTTHDWIRGELAQVPISFLTHIQRCIEAGHLISTAKFDGMLPDNFVAQAPRTDARFVFMTGDMNATFLPISQERSFDFFDKFARGRHVLQKIHGYGHLDPILGKNASTDVFPFVLEELKRD
jgi:hypothetical protein